MRVEPRKLSLQHHMHGWLTSPRSMWYPRPTEKLFCNRCCGDDTHTVRGESSKH